MGRKRERRGEEKVGKNKENLGTREREEKGKEDDDEDEEKKRGKW